MVTPAGHRDAGSLRPLGALLTETDDVLRRGGVAGAQVWPTAFPVLDATLTGGFRAGELVLLGGPAGHGKTTLGVQLARNAPAIAFWNHVIGEYTGGSYVRLDDGARQRFRNGPE